jgi:hypothetical protein
VKSNAIVTSPVEQTARDQNYHLQLVLKYVAHKVMSRLWPFFSSSSLPNNPQRLLVITVHVYEIRPRKDHRGVNLIADALPFGRFRYGEPNVVSNAISYASFTAVPTPEAA